MSLSELTRWHLFYIAYVLDVNSWPHRRANLGRVIWCNSEHIGVEHDVRPDDNDFLGQFGLRRHYRHRYWYTPTNLYTTYITYPSVFTLENLLEVRKYLNTRLMVTAIEYFRVTT